MPAIQLKSRLTLLRGAVLVLIWAVTFSLARSPVLWPLLATVAALFSLPLFVRLRRTIWWVGFYLITGVAIALIAPSIWGPRGCVISESVAAP